MERLLFTLLVFSNNRCSEDKQLSTASTQLTSFCYNIDEMPQELNSCLYPLACGELAFALHSFIESQNLLMLSENLTLIALWILCSLVLNNNQQVTLASRNSFTIMSFVYCPPWCLLLCPKLIPNYLKCHSNVRKKGENWKYISCDFKSTINHLSLVSSRAYGV